MVLRILVHLMLQETAMILISCVTAQEITVLVAL